MVKKNKLPVASMVTDVPCRPSAEDKARERRYRAEDALSAIERVEGYKKDKDLMKDVKSLARERMAVMKKVC